MLRIFSEKVVVHVGKSIGSIQDRRVDKFHSTCHTQLSYAWCLFQLQHCDVVNCRGTENMSRNIQSDLGTFNWPITTQVEAINPHLTLQTEGRIIANFIISDLINNEQKILGIFSSNYLIRTVHHVPVNNDTATTLQKYIFFISTSATFIIFSTYHL